MESALIFEHLVCDNISSAYYNVGAAMFNACLSEVETYENGVKVGKVFMLLKISLDKMMESKHYSQDLKALIGEKLSNIENDVPTIDQIVDLLHELKTRKVVL